MGRLCEGSRIEKIKKIRGKVSTLISTNANSDPIDRCGPSRSVSFE